MLGEKIYILYDTEGMPCKNSVCADAAFVHWIETTHEQQKNVYLDNMHRVHKRFEHYA